MLLRRRRQSAPVRALRAQLGSDSRHLHASLRNNLKGRRDALMGLAAQLEALLDGVVDKVISAQQPDGYLNTHFIHTQPEMRWKNLRDWHEMYCAGHLIQAAVALHHHSTGNVVGACSLMKRARKNLAEWDKDFAKQVLQRIVTSS